MATDHLHPHRRGAAAGDVLVPADHPGVRRRRRASTSRPATSRWPAASSPSSPTASPTSSASTTRSPSSASWPRGPRPTSSSCPTSAPRSRSSRRPIAELQEQGYALPDYPDDPQTDEEQDVRARYDKVKGSAVNPVLREGNSDRRAPASVKSYARKPPALDGRLVRRLEDQRRARWAHDDFRSNEQSVVARGRRHAAHRARRPPTAPSTVLKESMPVLAGEVVDATVMHVAALRAFLAEQIARAKAEGVLFSVHLKATMMKVSDPIIFGHAVQAFFPDVFAAVRRRSSRPRASAPNDGLGGTARRGSTRCPRAPAIEAAVEPGLADGPALAMVDSDRGITNLHVPTDVIVDASMPAMIRTSGQMWGPDGKEHDTLAVIPDCCYAGDLPGRHRRLPRPRRLRPGHDGLGAQRRPDGAGGRGVRLARQDLRDRRRRHRPRRRRRRRRRCSSTPSSAGDIWRACQTKDVPIRDWVKLAVTRARATGAPAVFWLDETRAHDANLIAKVKAYLARARHRRPRHRDPGAGARRSAFSLERIRQGEDTISVTGNVLRDYLTDLFPILELGTSAKMLSIVPLMNGGGLFETGAGGSAPKHVQQLVKENYLRWDSLGEFLALAASLRAPRRRPPATRGAQVLADTLDRATGTFLDENKSPARRVGSDRQPRQPLLPRALLGPGAGRADRRRRAGRGVRAARRDAAADEEQRSSTSCSPCRARPADIGGYYRPDAAKATAVMRPSATFNEALSRL